MPCKINIIEYNPIDGEPFQQAEEAKVDRFAQFLESKNLIVNRTLQVLSKHIRIAELIHRKSLYVYN